jgi:hypothetical protein
VTHHSSFQTSFLPPGFSARPHQSIVGFASGCAFDRLYVCLGSGLFTPIRRQLVFERRCDTNSEQGPDFNFSEILYRCR